MAAANGCRGDEKRTEADAVLAVGEDSLIKTQEEKIGIEKETPQEPQGQERDVHDGDRRGVFPLSPALLEEGGLDTEAMADWPHACVLHRCWLGIEDNLYTILKQKRREISLARDHINEVFYRTTALYECVGLPPITRGVPIKIVECLLKSARDEIAKGTAEYAILFPPRKKKKKKKNSVNSQDDLAAPNVAAAVAAVAECPGALTGGAAGGGCLAGGGTCEKSGTDDQVPNDRRALTGGAAARDILVGFTCDNTGADDKVPNAQYSGLCDDVGADDQVPTCQQSRALTGGADICENAGADDQVPTLYNTRALTGAADTCENSGADDQVPKVSRSRALTGGAARLFTPSDLGAAGGDVSPTRATAAMLRVASFAELQSPAQAVEASAPVGAAVPADASDCDAAAAAEGDAGFPWSGALTGGAADRGALAISACEKTGTDDQVPIIRRFGALTGGAAGCTRAYSGADDQVPNGNIARALTGGAAEPTVTRSTTSECQFYDIASDDEETVATRITRLEQQLAQLGEVVQGLLRQDFESCRGSNAEFPLRSGTDHGSEQHIHHELENPLPRDRGDLPRLGDDGSSSEDMPEDSSEGSEASRLEAILGLVPEAEDLPALRPEDGHAFKRTLCKHWLRGHCNRGEECGFAHGESEVGQPMPSRLGILRASRGGNVCKFWARGFCRRGSNCAFAHSAQEPEQWELAEVATVRNTFWEVMEVSAPCRRSRSLPASADLSPACGSQRFGFWEKRPRRLSRPSFTSGGGGSSGGAAALQPPSNLSSTSPTTAGLGFQPDLNQTQHHGEPLGRPFEPMSGLRRDIGPGQTPLVGRLMRGQCEGVSKHRPALNKEKDDDDDDDDDGDDDAAAA